MSTQVQQLPECVIPSLPIDHSNTTKEQIKQYFINSYSMYETLFRSIKEEAYTIAPDTLRRPIIWYLGHTATIYVQKLGLVKLCGSMNEWFEKFFKTGVDPILPEELDNDTYKEKMPSGQEIWAYRRQVFDKVIEIIDNYELRLPIKDTDPIFSIILGVEHEHIHYETSILLMRQLPVELMIKPKSWKYAPYETETYPRNKMIDVEGQEVILGKDREFPTYGWDNEYGKVKIDVKTFRASKYLISNGEFVEFYKNGCYDQKTYWDEEGWEWRQRSSTKHPWFWVPDEQKSCGFRYRCLYDVIDMPMNWPAEVSYHEARAYCRWKGNNFRMIREAEFSLIRGEHLNESYGSNQVNADVGAFDAECGNTNVTYGSSSAVDQFRASPMGFHDCYGNVFEWSVDWFRPFPGFKEHELYYDFSGGCFEHKHNLMLGSAWSSTGLNSSSFFRVGFRRHFYQNVGFRLVEEIIDDDQQKMYTDKVYLNRYLHFNFATNEEFFTQKSSVFNLDNYVSYPVKIAVDALKYFKANKKDISPEIEDQFANTHCLDLGCGMGRTAFELAKHFPKVTGLDYAHGFIDIANKLKEVGEMAYQFPKSGNIMFDFVAKVEPEIERNRVKFIQGDAMNLPELFGPFDLIVASNLIDRLYNPAQCLQNICPMLTYNGILIITSPYTWMESVAEKERWIGAQDGQTTFQALQEVMGTLCFELVDEVTQTLLIKEHERKFEFIMPHMTVWRKKTFSQEFATSIFRTAAKY